MELIRDFKKIAKNNITLAGGKGASLGEMTNSGIPVPPGFIILSSAFEKFLEETDLNVEIDAVLDSVDHKEMHTVETASEKIKALILQAEMPQDITKEIQKFFKKLGAKYVAVRSSATAEDSASAAWAGQLESYLNTTEKNLLENVKKCWASLFTPRAIFYRFEKDLHKQKISVAVVIQKMIESEKSGIAFSVHPVTQNRNQLIIEANFGLGEAIVSGQITPDSYVVEKQPRRIIDKNVQTQARGLYRAKNGGNEWHDIPKEKREKQVLSDKEILELSEIILKIENHYGFPCDIEWAFEKDKFYIVQSRPITTLNTSSISTQERNKKRVGEKHFIFQFSSQTFTPLILSLLLERTIYGNVDYIIFFHESEARAYLTKRGMDQAFTIGKRLLIKESIRRLLKNEKKLISDINSLNKFIVINDNNVDREWKKFLRVFKKFCNLYRYGAYAYSQPLEQFILSYISLEQLNNIYKGKIKVEDLPFNNTQKKKLKIAIQALDDLGKMRFRLHEEAAIILGFFMNQVSYCANKHNLSRELILYTLVDEFEKLLFSKKIRKSILNLISRRKEGCVFVKKGDKWGCFTGLNFTQLKAQVDAIEEKEIKKRIITGSIANKGFYAGRVVVHNDWIKTIDFKKGSVLVTGMTNPQMITFIKKAGAIITDQGGVTCHAAIISREFGIPCVVGTSIATKFLKTGDLVEVDANNGVVKILK